MIRWPNPYLPPINLWNVPRLEIEMIEKYEHTNIDNVETLLLMAMSVSPEYKESGRNYGPQENLGRHISRYRCAGDAGSRIDAEDKVPSRAYTFDINSDRVYTTDKNLLLHHPFEIMGFKAETMLLDKDRMKWMGFEETKRPKGFCPIGKADKWFILHYRTFTHSGIEQYDRTVVPMNKNGRALPFKVEGFNMKGPSATELQNQITMACSIIEDAHRPGVLLAECSCDSSLIFPVEYGAHKDFLALREGPKRTPTGRRNPILHFVRKHLRSTGTEIAKHWRGVDEVEINGMTLRLSSQDAEL